MEGLTAQLAHKLLYVDIRSHLLLPQCAMDLNSETGSSSHLYRHHEQERKGDCVREVEQASFTLYFLPLLDIWVRRQLFLLSTYFPTGTI